MCSQRKLIGEGKSAKIYREGNQVYKVFSDQYPLAWIEHEATIQNEVYTKTQLCVPQASYMKGSREIRMEYIEGCTLADRMRKEKYKQALEDLVETQASIHQYSHLNLSNAHDVFASQIQFSDLDPGLQDKALRSLNSVEKKQVLCHFDIHFLNIMYRDDGYVILDWVNAKLGNPALDIARTYIILKQYAQRLASKYLKLSAKKGHFTIEEIQDAIPAMAALRLIESDSVDFKSQLMDLIQPSIL